MKSRNFKGHDEAREFYKQSKKELIKDNADLRYVTNDSSFYGEIQKSWKANERINYGSPFGYIVPLSDRRVLLREGEGVNNFYLLEANLDHRFTLNMGRPHAPPWRRRSRTTFDYRVNFRMTLDDSSPIVPYSNDVGLSVESAVWDSYGGNIFKDKLRFRQITYDSLKSLNRMKHRFVTTLIQLHHYSNGQEPGSKFTDSQSETRNDYRKGDFSTNFFRVRLTWSSVNLENHSLLSIGLGIRHDMGSSDGTFVFTPAQDSAYGKKRVEFFSDWYSGILETYNPIRKRDNKWQLHTRIDGDLIYDRNLQNFDANLKNDNGKYRLGLNLMAEIRPLSHRSIGYLFHFYTGRDFLNIRYDDIIWTLRFGLTFSLDKYYPSGWSPKSEMPKLMRLLK